MGWSAGRIGGERLEAVLDSLPLLLLRQGSPRWFLARAGRCELLEQDSPIMHDQEHSYWDVENRGAEEEEELRPMMECREAFELNRARKRCDQAGQDQHACRDQVEQRLGSKARSKVVDTAQEGAKETVDPRNDHIEQRFAHGRIVWRCSSESNERFCRALALSPAPGEHAPTPQIQRATPFVQAVCADIFWRLTLSALCPTLHCPRGTRTEKTEVKYQITGGRGQSTLNGRGPRRPISNKPDARPGSRIGAGW